MSEKEYDEAVAAVEEYLKKEKYSDIVDAYKNARKYEYTEWHKQYCKVWYPNAYKEILIYEELVRRNKRNMVGNDCCICDFYGLYPCSLRDKISLIKKEK